MIGYNAQKSDLPTLLENGLDLEDQYAVDVFDEASNVVHLTSTALKISNSTPLQNFGSRRKSHDSLEDARMTALVYQQFLEFDQGRTLLEEQENFSTNPFGDLDLSGFFDE